MDLVEEIKSRLNIEDVIGEYVHLKRSGRNFKGLSPFTNEKTPSFIVSPEKQIWHDFSSGRGGNMFSFVMEMEGLDFKGSLDFLARKAGIDLSQFSRGSNPNRDKLKNRLFEALELAAKFYQQQFKNNQTALKYVFRTRGFNKPTVLAFRIGWAPEGPASLHKFMIGRGFTNSELQAAGLATKSRQPVDMFRSRLMVPLADPFGRIIGFTARLLNEKADAPKYINTPATVLYDKSRHIFGLHLAKEGIRKNHFAIMVEGNLDVIASYQAGVFNVIATAGTAATSQHLKNLSRFTMDIRMAFDQDSAGLDAAQRVIPLAFKAGVNLSVIKIDGAKDPDELIKKNPKLWAEAVTKPVYALEWLMSYYETKEDLTNAVGKKNYSAKILEIIKQIEDQVEQEHYLNKLAQKLNTSRESLSQKLSGAYKTPLRKNKNQPEPAGLRSDNKTQNQFLALALGKPKLRELLEPVTEPMINGEDGAILLRTLKQKPDLKHADFSTDAALRGISEYVNILLLQFEELYKGIDDHELGFEAKRVRIRLIEQYVKNRKTELSNKLKTANEATTKQLLYEVKKLDQLLHKNQDN